MLKYSKYPSFLNSMHLFGHLFKSKLNTILATLRLLIAFISLVFNKAIGRSKAIISSDIAIVTDIIEFMLKTLHYFVLGEISFEIQATSEVLSVMFARKNCIAVDGVMWTTIECWWVKKGIVSATIHNRSVELLFQVLWVFHITVLYSWEISTLIRL